MAARKTTDTADGVADAVSAAGRRTGARARRAGLGAAEAAERAADRGATKLRRAARKSVDAYDAGAAEINGQAASLEDAIRQNPLAAAGAALLIGVVLGRFIL